MPLAATVKLTLAPAVTVWLVGCMVIVGATIAAVTVKVTALLVALPAVFPTTQE